MTRTSYALVTCAVAALLAACATPPAPTSAIEFNYAIDNGKANGIVQVFDLSGNTVVQMRDLDQRSTQFLDAKNEPIPFKLMGQNVMLAGMHGSFTVSTPAAASRIVRKAGHGVAVQAGPLNAPASPSMPQNDAAIVAEISRIRKEIAELKLILASSHGREPAQSPTVLADVSEPTPTEPSVVIVSFANNSPQFNPAQDQQLQLRTMVQSAEYITVRGYTDSDTPTTGSVALSKARAEAARRYLVAMGAKPKKITVDHVPAGKFIADNRSPAGKAANRRVEIAGL